MNGDSLVLAHLYALSQQVDWAEGALEKADIEPWIKDAAKNGFAVLFEQMRVELKRMQDAVTRSGASAQSWKQLGRNGRLYGEIFGECLGFVGSALIRTNLIRNEQARKDDICELSDALLYELNKKLPKTINWSGLTLLAEGNFYTETTGLIRMPFPDYGIWNLPISAHELGHFVGPRISDGKGGFPFQTMLDQQKQENLIKEPPAQLSEEQLEQQLSHLKELFSDLFGVYTLGPAYACSCVLLRFNPGDDSACEDNETHPSYAKRAHFIFGALEQMNKTEGGTPYRKIKERLKKLWDTNLDIAGHGECLDAKDAQAIVYLLYQLYPILNTHLSTVRYRGWNRAVELRDQFLSAQVPAELLKPGDTIADVLNAAWLWRLSLKKETEHLLRQGHLRASELCRELM